MAKIAFRQSTDVGRQVSIHLAVEELPDTPVNMPFSDHIKQVLSLYSVCLAQLLRLRASLMDARIEDARKYRKNCVEIIQALDDDLDRSLELAQNFHTLYQHCLRHLGGVDAALPPIENTDAVQMVVARLRHLYVHMIEDEETDSS